MLDWVMSRFYWALMAAAASWTALAAFVTLVRDGSLLGFLIFGAVAVFAAYGAKKEVEALAAGREPGSSWRDAVKWLRSRF